MKLFYVIITLFPYLAFAGPSQEFAIDCTAYIFSQSAHLELNKQFHSDIAGTRAYEATIGTILFQVQGSGFDANKNGIVYITDSSVKPSQSVRFIFRAPSAEVEMALTNTGLVSLICN